MDEETVETILNMERLQCPRCKGIGFIPTIGKFLICRGCRRVFRLIRGRRIKIAPRQFLRGDGWLDKLDRKVGRLLTQEEVSQWKLFRKLPENRQKQMTV